MPLKDMLVRFWGVRGSIAAPLRPEQVEDKIVHACCSVARDTSFPKDDPAAAKRWIQERLTFIERSTFGGNTSCVEVRCDDALMILDMGTGLRELGISLLPVALKNKGLQGTILQSHVHWDHIQGYPFWKQLYMPRRFFDNRFTFFGGREWDRSLEDVLRGQMNAPVFPVDHRELEDTSMRMEFHAAYDGKEMRVPGPRGEIHITCRKLHHPQETFGYRIEYRGQVVTFCTDHEPYAGTDVHRSLVDLAKGADVFITDCQYSHDEYSGAGGKVQKFGWGHSYPEYIAAVADRAKPKMVVTTHHDPESSDERVVELAQAVENGCGIKTIPAYEGLAIQD